MLGGIAFSQKKVRKWRSVWQGRLQIDTRRKASEYHASTREGCGSEGSGAEPFAAIGCRPAGALLGRQTKDGQRSRHDGRVWSARPQSRWLSWSMETCRGVCVDRCSPCTREAAIGVKGPASHTRVNCHGPIGQAALGQEAARQDRREPPPSRLPLVAVRANVAPIHLDAQTPATFSPGALNSCKGPFAPEGSLDTTAQSPMRAPGMCVSW